MELSEQQLNDPEYLRNLIAEAWQDLDIERQKSELYKKAGERVIDACMRIVREGEKDVRGKYLGSPYPGDDVAAIWQNIRASVSFEKELEIVSRLAMAKSE